MKEKLIDRQTAEHYFGGDNWLGRSGFAVGLYVAIFLKLKKDLPYNPKRIQASFRENGKLHYRK